MNLSVVDPALQDWSTSGTMYDPPQPWDQDTSGKIRIDRLPSSVVSSWALQSVLVFHSATANFERPAPKAPEATQDPSEQASPKRTRGRPKGSKVCVAVSFHNPDLTNWYVQNKNPKEKTAPPVKQPKRRGRPPGVKVSGPRALTRLLRADIVFQDKPRDPNDPDRKLRGRPKGTKVTMTPRSVATSCSSANIAEQAS